jgi:hypothetical protein
MISRQTHIFRSAIIALLLVGFAAHAAVPFMGDAQKNAFTQWLGHNVVDSDSGLSDSLRDRIRELPKESDDFLKLVRDASKLISENEENFQLSPFGTQSHDDEATTWLIGQWSTYNHQQSSTKAVLPKILAPIQKWLTQVSTTGALVPEATKLSVLLTGETAISVPDIISTFFSPPSSGISINAP